MSPPSALSLTGTMHLAGDRPVQWSRNAFLSGTPNMHIGRDLFEARHPAQASESKTYRGRG